MAESEDPTTDWGALYRAHVDDITKMVRGLDGSDGAGTAGGLGTVVPGTPAWTVRQVVAHLAGGASDGIAGRTEGAPGPEWTARHVAERDDVPLEEVLDELGGNVEAIAASLEGTSQPGPVWDIATHHADLHEALGRGRVPEPLWRPIVDQLAPRRAPGALEAGVDPYELFRAIFSRRSRGQMRLWGLGLSETDLDAICVFGGREDDQPIPV